MEVSRIASISTTASVNSYPRSPKALKAHQNNLTQTDPTSFSGNSAPPALVLSAATFPPKSAELCLDRYFQIRIQTQGQIHAAPNRRCRDSSARTCQRSLATWLGTSSATMCLSSTASTTLRRSAHPFLGRAASPSQGNSAAR